MSKKQKEKKKKLKELENKMSSEIKDILKIKLKKNKFVNRGLSTAMIIFILGMKKIDLVYGNNSVFFIS